jgi:hypothetical protein
VGAPADTTAEAWEAQAAALRRLSGQQRLAIAFRLTRLAREACRSGIRNRHPEYGDDEVKRAFFRMLHDDEKTRSVWPNRELLEP